jgi:hypothetical protein
MVDSVKRDAPAAGGALFTIAIGEKAFLMPMTAITPMNIFYSFDIRALKDERCLREPPRKFPDG